ncbi:GNAT family N-acetyltransferase [Hymenobacter sp. BT770]|uniref:GNAT family N-acetyltransferase n=1 Tax=Hymenobacter sp. BT770 TaxID=2886942 RepID=UPI001D101BBF|nr:GNAT family N-acetyltransferase [Hymenobacter sp. BT770]MCC3151992.1 GNAT family N-acetyltransferase [Hymenobacter sp. BT770]MDO3417102.1 GNAT family N-acetyltransferase [Hymenobacter sp. BT770]
MTSDAPTAPPRIEPATLNDIPTIIQLAEATWEPTYRFIISREQIDYMYRVIYTPASLKRQMAEQHHSFLLAYVAGEPAGFASFSPQPAEEDGEAGYKLHKIYVLPTRQGQGLGVHLIEAVENAAREAGGKFLDLNVNRYNPAIAFYERRGFARHREVDVPIGPYFMNDYIMRKAL